MKMSAVSTREHARILGFDTEHFGIRVAETDHPDVDEWAAENAVGVLFMLCDTTEITTIQHALERGWLLTDVRVELAMTPFTVRMMAGVRKFTEEDEPTLIEIARSAHRITRFYADPHFSRESCDDLYEAWMRNSCDGWAEEVLVYGGFPPLGYVTVHAEREEASIGLIAVAEHARGQGVGTALCRSAGSLAHKLGCTRISTVTQGRNVPALRMFESCGFRVAKTGVWLHRWIER